MCSGFIAAINMINNRLQKYKNLNYEKNKYLNSVIKNIIKMTNLGKTYLMCTLFLIWPMSYLLIWRGEGFMSYTEANHQVAIKILDFSFTSVDISITLSTVLELWKELASLFDCSVHFSIKFHNITFFRTFFSDCSWNLKKKKKIFNVALKLYCTDRPLFS